MAVDTISLTFRLHQDQSLRISSETIKPTTVVRDLGVLLDSELSMKHHVTKLAAVCHTCPVCGRSADVSVWRPPLVSCWPGSHHD